jgi:hypothetical protein
MSQEKEPTDKREDMVSENRQTNFTNSSPNTTNNAVQTTKYNADGSQQNHLWRLGFLFRVQFDIIFLATHSSTTAMFGTYDYTL